MRSLRAITETPPRAVIYLRQSVAKDDSISIEMQETACRDYCARMGYDVVDVLADPGISGRVWAKRPKVQVVMRHIDDGNADVIVLWKWSRLSRSRVDWALAADRVEKAGGRIESATEPIDTSTASGEFSRGMMIEHSVFQSKIIGEVWEEVHQRRLRHGLPASGRLPFGWRWIENGIEPNPDQAPYVVEMYRRYLGGAGSAEIAKWLNREGVPTNRGHAWTGPRPFTVLDSPIHVGLIPYRGQTYPGAHDGIIDDETWQAYLAEREHRKVRGAKPRSGEHLLSQLLRCGCGARMHGKGAVTGGKWYGGYICGARRMAPEHPEKAYVSALVIDPAIVRWMLEFDIESAAGEAPTIAAESKRERLHRQQSRLEDEAANLLRDRGGRGDAPASVYDRALAGVTEELRAIANELRELGHAQRGRPDANTVYAMRQDWEYWPPAEQNQNLRRLISRIEISADGRRAEVFPNWPGDSSVIDL